MTKKAGYTPTAIRELVEHIKFRWEGRDPTEVPVLRLALAAEEESKLSPLMAEALLHCLACVRQYMPKPEGDLSVFSDYATAETIVYNVLRDAGVIE